MIGIPGPHGTTWDPGNQPCDSPGCGHTREIHTHHHHGTYCGQAGCDCRGYRVPLIWPFSWIRKQLRRKRP